MNWRSSIANKLHALAYRIEPQAWYARPADDGLANVEIVRDLGAGTFDVKRTPIQRRRTPAKPQPPVPKPGKGG